MLRSVVKSFLESVTEREFDSPLLTVLASRGYYDIHFTHGAFEFGKDVIAKHPDEQTGKPVQYAIQSKAGDIGMGDWRTIRPQIEEAAENTLSHPNFDASAPRVAVLATTGRLTGGALLDSQQLEQRLSARDVTFEVWDRQQFTQWISEDPNLALSADDGQLLQLIGSISQGTVREQDVEIYSRRWLPTPPPQAEQPSSGMMAIEAAVIANRLRVAHRLDLAAYTSLHLLRAAWARSLSTNSTARSDLSRSAVALFGDYVNQLLEQSVPLLSDPKDLLRAVLDPYSIVTYPVVCCRLIELFALLALVEEIEPDLLVKNSGGSAAAAVISLASHPGATRPVSDDFGPSLVAPAILLKSLGQSGSFLADSAQWIQDRYDQKSDGLGLGAHGEPEEVIAERLLGGALEATRLERRRASYLATVALDLAAALGNTQLYDAFRQNLAAYDIVPIVASANSPDFGNRSGPRVRQLTTVTYRASTDDDPLAQHHVGKRRLPAIDELLVASSTRTRHIYEVLGELAS